MVFSRLLSQVEESGVGSSKEVLGALERAGNFQPRLPRGSTQDTSLADLDNYLKY